MRVANKKFFSTLNDLELKKFARIGSQWWNSSSFRGGGPLHDMNPTRIQFIRDCLATKYSREKHFPTTQLNNLDILDVGSGGGLLAESLSRLGAQVTAIDPSQENIDVAIAHASKDPLTRSILYQKSTIEEMSKTNKKFDVVTVLEVSCCVHNFYILSITKTIILF